MRRNGLVECNHVNPCAWGIPSVGCFGLVALVMANFGNVVLYIQILCMAKISSGGEALLFKNK
jgi:hypothetical protein